ncbi:MAG: YbaB/EbfC family nucleoid-associated protein [Kiritimatiellae bacterium]|nr:YbaB/EbfC family nucleoid-associated protein [Kiritimatiellia bacterium]
MNVLKMMKQAADVQRKMGEMQASLAAQTVEFSSGGGMVRVTATGDLKIQNISIDPKVVNASDVEMLEDLVRAAVDGALGKARDLAAEQMKSVTAGLQLPPGFNLPS